MLENDPSESQRQEVTALLRRWSGGNAEALNDLMPIVYQHLHKLASSALAAENTAHTLSSTALVHEAYLRLIEADVSWKDRNHFFSLSARLMRRILVDHARAAKRDKRGGGALRVTLSGMEDIASSHEQLIHIDAALENLERLDERKARLIDLVYFAGCSQADAAAVLGISESTLNRELRLARAWLRNELNR